MTGADMTSDQIDEAFERFWAKYPAVKGRKANKQKCREKFAKIAAADELDRLRRSYALDLQRWQDPRERSFAPSPHAYLNQRKWDRDLGEDETEDANVSPFERYHRKVLARAIKRHGTLTDSEARNVLGIARADWQAMTPEQRQAAS